MTHKELSEIFKEHRVGLLYFTERIIGDNRYSEDIVADAFVKLFEHGDSDKSPVGFLYNHCRNKSLNFLRDEKRHKNDLSVIGKTTPSEEQIEVWATKAHLFNFCVKKSKYLPVAQKKIFDMIFIHDLSVEEISTILGISPDTIRTQKFRIINWFKKLQYVL